MMLALLIAGVGAILAGLLAILFGIPVKEFSFGNTLILVGAVGVCTGMILLGLYAVIRELKLIARRLGPAVSGESRMRPMLPPGALPGGLAGAAEEGSLFGSQVAPDPTKVVPPWQMEAPRERSRPEAPPLPESAASAAADSAPRQRRNLLFASSSRKERERAQARTGEGPPADQGSPSPASLEPGESPPASFDDAWPVSERRSFERSGLRRASRTPPTLPEPDPAPAAPERQPPAATTEGQPAVTVLKSGVVDGMAYSLYSDGSIEAQMPEGMMRFASIDELRAHLDQKS
jgi:hypothetical protein